MIKNQDKTKFLESLDELNKPAKDALERCVNSEETLFGFLKKGDVAVNELFQRSDLPEEFKELCKTIGFHPESDSGFNAELYRNYFLTFFSSMRKAIKKESING